MHTILSMYNQTIIMHRVLLHGNTPLVYFHIEVVEEILLSGVFSFNAEVERLADIHLCIKSSSVDVSTLLCCLASSILVEWSERELEHR